VLTADGKLTLVGTTGNGSVGDVAMVRYMINQTPTDLSLSSVTIAENQPIGTVLGTLSSTDADAGDTFTYTLVNGTGSTDNAAFEIVGNQLKTKQAFDFETKNAYSIRVKTTDAFGASIEKELKISISDVTENLIPVKPKPKGDPIVGTSKNDRLVGTAEDDLIRGLKGNDKLVGRAANDILVGGLGNDILKGGVGDDVLRGGGGKDICFLQNNGLDTIRQFSDGQDKLKLTGGLTFSNLVITQQGNDVLIGTATSKFALIAGIQVSQITAADFV
jgi:Ca2+-binding RTX toxin-like protein